MEGAAVSEIAINWIYRATELRLLAMATAAWVSIEILGRDLERLVFDAQAAHYLKYFELVCVSDDLDGWKSSRGARPQTLERLCNGSLTARASQPFLLSAA